MSTEETTAADRHKSSALESIAEDAASRYTGGRVAVGGSYGGVDFAGWVSLVIEGLVWLVKVIKACDEDAELSLDRPFAKRYLRFSLRKAATRNGLRHGPFRREYDLGELTNYTAAAIDKAGPEQVRRAYTEAAPIIDAGLLDD